MITLRVVLLPLLLPTVASAHWQSRVTPRVAAERPAFVQENRPAPDGAVELNRLREEGVVALYNLDYKSAEDRFLKMTALAPEHPAGYFYLANNFWLKVLNDGRRLSSSLYSSASFYAQKGSKEKVNPATDREFTRLLNKALQVADTRVRADPKDPEALYYKAGALGLSAAYTVTVRRSFRRAFGDAKKSINLQNQVLKLDSGYTDAYLNIGLYEYVAGSLPLINKILLRLVGVNGSKEAGIKQLELVANRGKYARDDARVLLIAIYSREDQPERALDVITELVKRYSDNYLLGIERAVMLYHMGRGGDGGAAFEQLLINPSTAALVTDAVNYQWGEALMAAGNYADAITRYKAVAAWTNSDRSLIALAHLRSGQALDALGRRAEALLEYGKVLALENAYDSHARANKHMKKPFVPGRK